MTYTIVFVFFMFIQFVLPFLLIVVIDIIGNIVTIAYGCFFTNVQSIEIPAFREEVNTSWDWGDENVVQHNRWKIENTPDGGDLIRYPFFLLFLYVESRVGKKC
ncbi:hypothetical protein ACJX0J_036410 [Zea mays]